VKSTLRIRDAYAKGNRNKPWGVLFRGVRGGYGEKRSLYPGEKFGQPLGRNGALPLESAEHGGAISIFQWFLGKVGLEAVTTQNRLGKIGHSGGVVLILIVADIERLLTARVVADMNLDDPSTRAAIPIDVAVFGLLSHENLSSRCGFEPACSIYYSWFTSPFSPFGAYWKQAGISSGAGG